MEEWKTIIGYEPYMVSNIGRIKRNDYIRQPQISKNGYCICSLSIDGIIHTLSIHRLVYIAFISSIEEGYEIDHIDRNRQNNNVSNLRIASRTFNNYNQNKKENTTSKYKGVSWCNTKQRWRCSIKINGKQINRYCKTEEDAGRKHDELVLENNLQDYITLNFKIEI